MTYEFEIDDHSVDIAEGIEVRLTANVEYDPYFENGDFDYAGTHCTHGIGGTCKVGMQLEEVTIDSVEIISFTVFVKSHGKWVESNWINLEEYDKDNPFPDKNFIKFLENAIREDGSVIQQAFVVGSIYHCLLRNIR